MEIQLKLSDAAQMEQRTLAVSFIPKQQGLQRKWDIPKSSHTYWTVKKVQALKLPDGNMKRMSRAKVGVAQADHGTPQPQLATSSGGLKN